MTKQVNFVGLALCLAAGLCVCIPAGAQVQSVADLGTEGTTNRSLDSSYAGEPATPHGINAELETRVVRNTNVFSNNAHAYSDFIFEQGALINLWTGQPRWNIAVQYRPTVLTYKRESSLDSFDQALSAAGTYSFTPRFRFQGLETLSAFTGILLPSSNQYYVLPTSTVPGLNSTLIAPTSHEISDGSEGHILYDVTPRGSLDLMGSYLAEHFTGIHSVQQGILSPTLLNTNGATAGASYRYRVSPQLTMGVRYLFQYFHYGPGGSDQTHTGYLTAHWAVAEHAGLDLYAGPSYSTAAGVFLPVPGANQNFKTFTTLSPTFGGTFSFRSDESVLNLTAERSISNGGGLLMTVMSNYEGAELRRRISDTWDIVATGGYGRSVALQPGATKGKIDTQTFGAALERPLFEKLSVHFEYDYLRQRVNSFVPLGTNLNANQFSVALFYRIGEQKL